MFHSGLRTHAIKYGWHRTTSKKLEPLDELQDQYSLKTAGMGCLLLQHNHQLKRIDQYSQIFFPFG